MKRIVIIASVLLLSGIVFAGPPPIPPKNLIAVSANCNQPQYYVLGKVCQSSVDGKLYKGDGNQIIELAAGTSEGDMLGAFYASEGRIRPLRGGTGIDSSGLSGFPLVTSGVWSVLNNAGVKSALGYLTSTDYPVTGVASPTAGMIPKWGVSGNTLVDGYDVTAFQAALTNPVTGVASPSAGYLTKWGLSGNSIVDGLKIGTMTDGKVCTFSDTDGMECDTTITGGGSMVYPSAGIPVSTGEGWGSPATYSNITGLWASGACSGYLKSDGSCDTPQGGGGYTNLTSFVDQTAWRLFYSDSSGDVKELALGTNGQYLMSNGASAVPSWGTPSGGSGFDVAGNYTPTGVWNWGTVGAGTTWPTFNQNTTGNAATATTATSATTATNLSNYSVLYNGSMTDGHMVSYRSADGKLQDAGAPVAYTPPALNAPLCGASGAGVGACTNLTDTAIPTAYTDIVGMWASGSCTGYLKSDGSCDTPSGGGNGIDYTPPEDPAPLCSDITGAIIACTNLKDQDLAEIEGSADDIGVKVETISTDPEEVIVCEGKDRNYIVGFNEPSFFQLPADPSGVRYCFGNNDYGAAISIVPATGDTITHGGAATTSGQGLVSTGSAQDWVCLLGLSASKWRTISSLGTWSLAAVELPEEPEGNEADMSRGFEVTLASRSDAASWAVTDTESLLVERDSNQKHSGSYSMSITGGVTTIAYHRFDTGDARTSMSLSMWAFFDAASESGDTTTTIAQIGASSTGTYGAWWCLRRSSGNYIIGVRGNDSPIYGQVALSPSTWYRIEVSYSQGGSSRISVFNAAGTLLEGIDFTANNVAGRYFFVGRVAAASNSLWNGIYLDDIGLNWTNATTPLYPFEVDD